MSTPIDPDTCHVIKTFARSSLRAVLSKSQARLGDLDVPFVMHVYSGAAQCPVLTMACTQHRMQHEKQSCEIHVFDEDGKAQGTSLRSTSAEFEQAALGMVRAQFRLGPPEQGGIGIRLLQGLQMSALVLSIVVTAAAIAFVVYQTWHHPAALLESKNPGTVAAWVVPGSLLFAVSAWAKSKIVEMRGARL